MFRPVDGSAGTTTSRPMLYVSWITLATIGLAFFSSDPVTDNFLRPLFFLALLSFFLLLGRREPRLRSLPFRMLEMGFLLLSLGSLVAAILRQGQPPLLPDELRTNLAFVFDRGVGFLLGFSLLAYGIVLWVPEIVESQHVLEENLARQVEDSQHKEQALRQANDLIARQEALVSIGELAAGVAHELRNPLAVLTSALQRVRDGNLDPEERSRCLDVMERAVLKANRRISGLLDLGRETAFSPRWFDGPEFFAKCLDLVRPIARAAEVAFAPATIAPGTLIHADPDLLLQVLMNLLRNAIQAGPHRGPICLAHEPATDGACRITVEDRGKGIAAEHLLRLFTPFFTTKEDGTGIGLTISASLVERHGGRLRLEPRPDGGARATVELPPPAIMTATAQAEVSHG